jgi:UDP-N-acetylglucosamine 4,6-dehydratase
MEAIKTNIIGCSNVIDAALDVGVKKVIGLSTDKAVNPINLYGATKLAGEKLFIQSNAYAGGMHTRFSCVRYGNVIGSRGSVVPLILAQKNSGKISITDKRMTRFWITLNHGAHFVIDCLKDMNGGEVFIPKIPSMKIMDLAKVIAPESKIDFIGIRPGEKLHEVLISEDEARFTIELEKMYLIQPDSSFWFGKGWEGKGKKIPEGFTYTSNNNPSWLNEIEIRKLINSYE